jgi:hypothetical protein
MKTFKLMVRGKRQMDVELAVAESMRLICKGNLSGCGEDEDGDGEFSFYSEGEYEEEEGDQ